MAPEPTIPQESYGPIAGWFASALASVLGLLGLNVWRRVRTLEDTRVSTENMDKVIKRMDEDRKADMARLEDAMRNLATEVRGAVDKFDVKVENIRRETSDKVSVAHTRIDKLNDQFIDSLKNRAPGGPGNAGSG